ncbi:MULTISPECIES: hypothetical protein [Marinomonas]|uniref:Uncharacterized protein n=1 Tax=Marinomonas rhodophyticola TaxID=2992803 RepID=A0ABT3KGJ1_9GAMM|nr:hypothetical protein [Marinomonas sp. KJ51-3]MCW4629668.1 hypothetical protein [Marinomonas sp. KJ51-3]
MIYRRLLRTLLLPIDLRLEQNCIETMTQYFNQVAGTSSDDHTVWLDGQVNSWDETGNASIQLKELINNLLENGNQDYATKISESYFNAHTELVSNQLVPSKLARSFLSHLLLITRLADEEKMSCAQISKILDAMNPSAGFGRRSVEAILKKMKMAPSITTANITDLFETDKSLISEFFGDATLDECAITISRVAYNLGFKGELNEYMSSLLTEEELDKFTPYVQILHYQCSILEYYDHNVKDFYEFSPRGQAAARLFSSYPSAMLKAGNPFLNNAKSVGQINFPWAAAKKNNEFPGASALFSILDGLDEMGYAARQELALWIRCFIHKFMVTAEPLDTPLPNTLDANLYSPLINNIARENTSTRGIIEQRLVDSLAGIMHLGRDGWVGRGIGDSVNASNLSKKKLGDCDFQHIANRRAVAYEAHGGELTQTYLNEHLRTLPKSAQPRIDEWKTFSNASDWHVNIIFVAHRFNVQPPAEINIDGVTFNITFISYNDLIAQTTQTPINEVIDRHLLAPLSRNNTPSYVRQTLLDLLV